MNIQKIELPGMLGTPPRRITDTQVITTGPEEKPRDQVGVLCCMTDQGLFVAGINVNVAKQIINQLEQFIEPSRKTGRALPKMRQRFFPTESRLFNLGTWKLVRGWHRLKARFGLSR